MTYIDLSSVQMAPLPEKKPGRHRFIAVASFVTSEETIHASYEGSGVGLFDHENLWDFAFGCIDCEEVWTKDLRRFCAAPAYVPPEEQS